LQQLFTVITFKERSQIMALWVVRCGGDGSFEQEALAQNIVGIGWGKLGDISKLES
jgi:hypothetical protein